MLAKILSMFGGGTVRFLTKASKTLLVEYLNAKTTDEANQIKADLAVIDAKLQISLAEQNHNMTRWIRPAFVTPFVIYLFKVVVWDKVLGLGTTETLSTELWVLFNVMVGFYFVGRAWEKKK